MGTEGKGLTISQIMRKSDGAQNTKAISFTNMSEIIKDDRPWKIQIEGEYKTGKSRFVLSILNDLYFNQKIPLEDILMVYIDLDNGVIPLIKQGIIPEELASRIQYHMCSDFMEVEQTTQMAISMLEDHVKEHGLKGAWLIIDNMGIAWEWARDSYTRTVYGKPMRELMVDAKQRAKANAAAKGKTSGRIPANPFDRLTDYAVINPLHNDWAESIKNCNINFVWTALLKYEEKEVSGNQKVIKSRGEGQKHNSARVDFIVRKKIDGGAYLTDLIGSRYTESLFVDEKNMTFGKLREKIEKVMEIEINKRDKRWGEIKKSKGIKEKKAAKKDAEKAAEKKNMTEEVNVEKPDPKPNEDKPKEDKPKEEKKGGGDDGWSDF